MRRIGTFVLVAVAMAATARGTTSESYGSLPQADYSSNEVAVINTGTLQTLFDMTKGFTDIVFKPYSTLKTHIERIIQILIGNTNESILDYVQQNAKEIVELQPGYVACLTFGVLFILLVPLVGAIMCCCRCCCDKCGGHLQQSEKRKKSGWRLCLCFTMLILTTLMAIPTVFVFITNEWIAQTVDNGGQRIKASADDMCTYLDHVPLQINYTTDQFNNTVYGRVRPLVADLGTSFGTELQGFFREQQSIILGSDTTAQNQTEALSAMQTITASLGALNTGMATLDTSLANLRTNMDSALSGSPCNTDPQCVDVFNSIGQLGIGFAVADVTPLSTDLDPVNTHLSAFNISTIFDTIDEEIDGIPTTVTGQTQSASDDAVAALDSALNSVSEVSSQLPISSLDDLKSIVNSSISMLIDAIDTYNRQYEQYRYIAGAVLGAPLALVAGFYLLGILVGSCGFDRHAPPGKRGCLSNCGGILLMAGVGISFIFSWLLMILVVVFFSVGGIAERYGCQGLEEPDYQTIPLAEKAAGTNLGQNIGLPAGVELSIVDLLNSCRNDESVYTALKLEHIYNITTLAEDVDAHLTSLRTEMDNAAGAVDLSAIDLYSAADQTFLLALRGSGIETVDYDDYLTKLGSGIVTNDLEDYGVFLAQKAARFSDTTLRSAVFGFVTDVIRIHDDEVQPLEQPYQNLQSSINKLIEVSPTFDDGVAQLDASLTAFSNKVDSDSTAEIQAIANDLYGQISGNITDYTTWLQEQIRNQVGRCRPAYDAAFTNVVEVFCNYLTDSLNGLWFSLGWFLFLLLPSAIVAMKLMKFYRRMNYEEVYENDWNDMEMQPPSS